MIPKEKFEKETGCTPNEVGYEKYIEWLESKFTSGNSDYVKCACVIRGMFEWEGDLSNDKIVEILKQHFA